MEFLYNNNTITVSSDKKSITLDGNLMELDGLSITCSGEYEKSGFLIYAQDFEDIRFFMFRVEGFWIGYFSQIPTVELPSKIFDFLGNVDILLAPFGKKEQVLLEQIEPKMLVSFGENASELVPVLGQEISSGNSYKLKAQDLSQDKTSFVILG